MKKIITVLFCGAISAFAITSNVSAQSFGKGIAFTAIKNYPALAAYAKEYTAVDKSGSGSAKESLNSAENALKTAKANSKALKANFKATENFRRAFKNAPDATWNVEQNAIVASFSRDSVKTNVVYSNKGYLIHSLSYFPASKTPAAIRSIVESDYPNGDITSAIEVNENGMDYFIVNLEDKRTFKQVTVYEGATNLINTLKKM